MKRVLSISVLLLFVLSGCDTDFLNSGCRSIGNSGYSLCLDKDGPTVFYLEPDHKAPSSGGVLNGTVRSIGWNDKVIVASRHSTFRGDPDGLMVVDIESKKVDGPLGQEVVARQYPSIKLLDASDAWKTLR